MSEGLQKFLFPELVGVGRFRSLGIPASNIVSYGVAGIEVACSICILARYKVKFFVLPLYAVMAGALYYTKLPMLIHKGFWKTAHEGRTDFSMIMGLTFLWLTYRKSNR